ncbi:unnamed protein product [Caenorhabditis angaria]|uniref:Uncharacterized protein n=1 Tax=Caenorhabditis angaria TaxID=860376 RepID=A0A9P1N7F1_9PELO|nr:unnamed protein product [Caenorhabditis angaria]
MEPLLVSEVQLYQEKIIGKKWKLYVAAFFDENQLGKARIELYQSESKMKILDVSRIIMLEHCISLRPAKTENGISFVKLQFRDESSIQLSCDDLPRCIDALSAICFPKKYVTIAPSTSLDSPSVEDEFFEFPDSYPVLKLKRNQNGREMSEGFYTLTFSDSLHLNGENGEQCIPYSTIVWIATGEHCVGFEVENLGVFEFASGDGLLIVEHFRSFLRFTCNFSTPDIKTVCRFNRYFHPNRQEIGTMSNNSTMESVDSGGVYSKIVTSADTSVSSLQLNESEFVNNVVKNELRRNASAEMLRHKISFLQKKKNESRTDFEENAETDFVRLQIPKSILSEQNRFPSNKNVSFEEPKLVPRQTDI